MGEQQSIYRQILDEVQGIGKKQDTHADRLTRIETLLRGNGTRGLCQRLQDTEDATKALERGATVRAARAGAIAGVLGFLGGALGKVLLTAIGILH